ncbi:F-box only protein 43 [Triplophysa tibetana]|uniref:F-box only protein 43 n=1 Tax=Triplophysa tibetana TaxID=1572043 RepID=A0A5A9N0Q9_9TELE|nr:F-box only protein 43 [Triplophysa tibetana]
MERTQVTSEYFQTVKYQTCGSCMDRHQSPRIDVRMARFSGTKENREHRKHQKRLKDVRESQRDPPVQPDWCETPKIKKKDVSLRRRLLMSRSLSDGSKGGITTPGETSVSHRDDSFHSPDISPTGPLTFSTLKADDVDFSCRKRRLLFSQVVTSTLDTGGSAGHVLDQNPLVEPDLDESIIAGLPSSPQTNDLMPLMGDPFQSPLRAEKQKRNVLDTPSLTLTPASEDSGFSSIGLDKSHDDSVDHDGSFQELVLPLSSGDKERRRSRLERQRRLSTLREGGSQSEDVPRDQRVGRRDSDAHASKDEVFLDKTPLGSATLKMQDLSLTPALQVVHAISRCITRVLHQQTSLEELLRVSEEDGAVRSRLPLSGLIGRKMGLDRVDIITELTMRNLRHILSVILSLLSPADVYRFALVSDDWNDVISEDRKASYRRRCHMREMKMAVEAGRTPHVADADTRLMLSSRSALSSVQAQARTPHTPHTPTQHHTETHFSTKRMEFLQVAKTLFNDEYLKPCPRCQHPARCHSLRGEGLCSWTDCSFRFCVSCLCAFHGSRDCAHLSGRRRSRRDVLPGSAQSKRNIRRL